MKELDLRFGPSPAVLPEKDSETVLKAVGILTKNKVLSGGKEAWKLGKRAFLSLKVLLSDGRRTVTCRQDPETGKTVWKVYDGEGRTVDPNRFFHQIHESPEESKAGCFDPERSYEETLKTYLEPERFFTPRRFFRMTEGIGTTRLFRMKLLNLRNKGPSEKEGTERNFEFFQMLRSLWDEIEEVRDMHHEKWPVFIRAESPEKTERILAKWREGNGRQVIVVGKGG